MPFDFLNPVNIEEFQNLPTKDDQIGVGIHKYIDQGTQPDLANYKIAIVGVRDARGDAENRGAGKGSESFRRKLYTLHASARMDLDQVIDLGDILPGKDLTDTYSALGSVIGELLRAEVIPVIIGGSVDLSYGQFLGYEKTDFTVNIASVAPRLGLGGGDEPFSKDNYLSKIILHQPNYLFNYSNLGYQSYYVGADDLALLQKLNFDAYRLGTFSDDIKSTEPIIRNADMLCFDLNAVRGSDFLGSLSAGANGLYGDQACQLSWYAGMSDKLTCAGFYGLNPEADVHFRSADLLSQMVWYFIDGYYNRKKDYPFADKSEYTKYTVNLEEGKEEVIFYKSGFSDRWWMEVPYPSNISMKYKRHMMVPCTYHDYERACENELPDRWLLTYQKLR